MSGSAISPSKLARINEAKRRWYALTPPEGVTVRFEVASIVARFGAQILDLLITFGSWFALVLAIYLSPIGDNDLTNSILFLLLLMIRAPYYIITELIWNGRTLGKRILGLRVIGADGRGLSTHAVVARNLMKEVEVLAPATFLLAAGQMGWVWSLVIVIWIFVLILVPAVHARRQRIGDILANTVVVADPRPVLAPELAVDQDSDQFVFTEEQLSHYGRFELQTLEAFLRAHPLTSGPAVLDAAVLTVAAQIQQKIKYTEPVPDDQALAFLHAFYAAQRAFLERKQLYGDVREDKHHAQSTRQNDGDTPS